jgi:hypothetical protein
MLIGVGSTPTEAQHVGIDRTFGTNGFAKAFAYGPQDDSERFSQSKVIPLGDGRAYVFVAQGRAHSIAMFTADGNADPTFNGGTALEPIQGYGICSVDELTRILCTHSDYTDNPTAQLRLRRILANGVLDSSFGSGGIATFTVPSSGSAAWQSSLSQVSQIARKQSASGYFLRLGQQHVVSVTESGGLDLSFGTSGILEGSQTNIIAIDGQGRQYKTESAENGATISAIVRHLATGQIDPSYGESGRVALPSLVGTVDLSVIGNDGRLYVGLAPFPSTANETAIVRVLESGQLDNTWADNGVLRSGPILGRMRIESVSATGQLLISNQSPDTWTTWIFRKFTATGQPDLQFGGKGVTRVPDETNTRIRIVAMAFDDATGTVIGGGSSSTPQQDSVVAIRLAREFIHRVRINQFYSASNTDNTPRTRFAYMDPVSIRVDTAGDAGPPANNMTVSINDTATTGCNFAFGSCSIVPTSVGLFTPTLSHEGDFMYTGAVLTGTPIEVHKATIRVDVSYYSQWWTGTPKRKVFREISPAIQPRFLTGTFKLSDGEGSCTIPASAFVGSVFFPHGTAGCGFSHKSPGEKTITVRLLGDPNIEEVVQMGGTMRATVYPAVTSGEFTNPNGKRYSFQFIANDPHCGLYDYGGFWSDLVSETVSLPDSVRRAWMREGGAVFNTVDDCAPGFNAQITVQEVSNQKTISASYTAAQDGSFSRTTHSPVGTMSFSAIDNGAGDSGTTQRPGEMQFVTVFESTASDAVCFVDLREPRKNSLAILLIRYALGFRDTALVDGTEFGYSEMSYWSEYFSCSSCAAEIDLNGNGIIDLTDGLLLKRWLTGQRSQSAISSAYVAPPGGRSAEQVLSYLQSGCR